MHIINRRLERSLGLLLVLAAAGSAGCKSSSSPDANGRPDYPYPDGGPPGAAVDSTPDAPADPGPGPDAITLDAPAPRDVLADRPPADVRTSRDAVVCPLACDDNNPCTIDLCDPSAGCVHSFADPGSVCSNPCLAGGKGTCSASSICEGAPGPDGTACEDQNPCTLGDTCKQGQCFSGSQMPCPAIDGCHEPGYCERSTGVCTTPFSVDGKGCDDGVTCTLGDQCSNGKCGGTAIWCSTGATCTTATGVCNTSNQVAFPSATMAIKLTNTAFAATGALTQDPSGLLYITAKAEAKAAAGSADLVYGGL
ncbi:MAG TPA: hypothetical protein VF518_09415, partial [Polyangia bacterium]